MLCTLLWLSSKAIANVKPHDQLVCLSNAYPDHLASPSHSNSIRSHSGKLYPFNPETTYRNYDDELDKADLYSQLRQPYQAGYLKMPPSINQDPGRLRHSPLFMDMYGKSSVEVSSKLVSVRWAPCDCRLLFSSVNGAAKALETVGDEIKQAGLSNYVSENIGTFNWRMIAGTNRLSMHAFGIAIDFKLPKMIGRYWKWDGGQINKYQKFPEEILRSKDLNRIVSIFESQGFIWGGKWWHYDSIHFEYRPELALFNCSQNINQNQN